MNENTILRALLITGALVLFVVAITEHPAPSAQAVTSPSPLPATPSPWHKLATLDGAPDDQLPEYQRLVITLSDRYPEDETKVSRIVANSRNTLHKDGNAVQRNRSCLDVLHDLDSLPMKGGSKETLTDKAAAYALFETHKRTSQQPHEP